MSPELKTRIEQVLQADRVVLFMKGNPASPQCGFSAKASAILNDLVPGYGSVDVLADAELREGIKEFGQWPTIPQLYIDGELVGGSDIIEQMMNSGELHAALGVPAPDRTPPMLFISPEAAAAITRATEGAEPGLQVLDFVGTHRQTQARVGSGEFGERHPHQWASVAGLKEFCRRIARGQ